VSAGLTITIDGVRYRDEDARARGIHPEQVRDREEAAVAAEIARREALDAEKARAEADFQAKVDAAVAAKLAELQQGETPAAPAADKPADGEKAAGATSTAKAAPNKAATAATK
jgi:hypothetical protein